MKEGFFRTFIGLPIEAGPVFLDARRRLMDALDKERITWVAPERFHVTLRFLGDTPAGRIDAIMSALDSWIELPEKTAIPIRNLGYFAQRKNPRVIWVGFEEQKWMMELKEQMDRALDSCGYSEADKPFRPHLTLARVKGLQNRHQFYRVIEDLGGLFRGHFAFDRLVFYRSKSEQGGPVYTPLKCMDFR